MKKIFKIIGIIIASFFILSLLFGKGSDENKSVKEAFNEGQEKAEKALKGDFKDQEVTEENIKSALAGLEDISYSVMGEKEITKIEIVDNAGTEDIADDKIVNVYFKPETWNEEHTMMKASGTAVEVMRRLFAHPKITSVIVWTEGEFTDQYGKTETKTAVRVGMERPTAEKIEWDKFKDMVLGDYNKLFDIADTKYIHPAIKKAL